MKRNVALMILLSFALVLMNCEAEDNPSVWDPEDEGAPTPVITEVTPANAQYGGVGTKQLVTIDGENFNSEVDGNFVYFGNVMGDVIEAFPNQLKVAAPANYKDSLKIEVHSHGAYLPAVYGTEENPVPYSILSPVEKPGNFTGSDKPGALAVDNENNLFVASESRLFKVTPEGDKIYYGNLTQPCTRITITPDGAMAYNYLNYVLKTDSLEFDPDVAKPTSEFLKTAEAIRDFEYDSEKNMIVISRSTISFADIVNLEIKSEQVFEDYSFITGRFYNGTLYLFANYIGTDADMTEGPYLLKIGVDAANAALTGDLQMVYNFDELGYPDISIKSIDITTDGKLYLGSTTHSMLISNTVEAGVFDEVFPQILEEHMIHDFKWSNDEYIFINTKNSNDDTKTTILKLMVFEESADHYGRN